MLLIYLMLLCITYIHLEKVLERFTVVSKCYILPKKQSTINVLISYDFMWPSTLHEHVKVTNYLYCNLQNVEKCHFNMLLYYVLLHADT